MDRAGEALTPEWWTAELDFKVGSVDDPDYSLTWFRHLTVSESGRIFTSHSQEQLVRMFEPDGTLAGTLGGQGQGPGEFRSIGTLGWIGDTLWVMDYGLYRFNLFSEEGEFLDSFTVPFDTPEDRNQPSPPRADGVLFDGTVYGSPPAFSRDVESGVLTDHHLLVLNREGEVQDSIVGIPFGNNQWAVYDPDNRERGMLFGRQPFGDGPLWGFMKEESALAILTREAPNTPEEATLSLVKLALTGDTIFSRNYRFEPDPIQPEEIDSILDFHIARWVEYGLLGGVTAGRLRPWAERNLYTPAFRPGVSELVVGLDGGFWLKTAPDDGESATWLVLDPEGSLAGRVLLPKDVQVLAVESSTVWGTVLDELDVPYLVRYRIVTP
jgi:hypothetical protein